MVARLSHTLSPGDPPMRSSLKAAARLFAVALLALVSSSLPARAAGEPAAAPAAPPRIERLAVVSSDHVGGTGRKVRGQVGPLVRRPNGYLHRRHRRADRSPHFPPLRHRRAGLPPQRPLGAF